MAGETKKTEGGFVTYGKKPVQELVDKIVISKKSDKFLRWVFQRLGRFSYRETIQFM